MRFSGWQFFLWTCTPAITQPEWRLPLIITRSLGLCLIISMAEAASNKNTLTNWTWKVLKIYIHKNKLFLSLEEQIFIFLTASYDRTGFSFLPRHQAQSLPSPRRACPHSSRGGRRPAYGNHSRCQPKNTTWLYVHSCISKTFLHTIRTVIILLYKLVEMLKWQVLTCYFVKNPVIYTLRI